MRLMMMSRYAYGDEVLLHDHRIVCLRLSECIGYAMIYHCSRRHFMQKVKGTSNQWITPEKFCRHVVRKVSTANPNVFNQRPHHAISNKHFDHDEDEDEDGDSRTIIRARDERRRKRSAPS